MFFIIKGINFFFYIDMKITEKKAKNKAYTVPFMTLTEIIIPVHEAHRLQ